jgi:hypothetical protein
MKTYHGALAEIRKYGGRWEVLKMRCQCAWISVEAHCMPKRSRARARALVSKGRP